MPLRQAYLQQSYRWITISFAAIVALTMGGVVYAANSHATVTIIPRQTELEATLSLSIGPADDTNPNRLPGTISREPLTATVAAQPDGEGTDVPAHATGQVTFQNTTGKEQPLAAGTRLRSTNDIIVRTTARVDVPARGSVVASVVADPLGDEGNLAAGKFIIVALSGELQQKIYAESSAPLAGGLTRQSGALSVDRLTDASNKATEDMQKDFGKTEAGVIRSIVPAAVTTNPKPDVPSAEYQVTVTATGVEITYDQERLRMLMREALTARLAADQELASVGEPAISLGDQPTDDTIELTINVTGQALINAKSELLQPKTLINQDRTKLTEKLQSSLLIQSASVATSPWWRSTTPTQAEQITVIIKPPAKR